jgi:hypothetical protein
MPKRRRHPTATMTANFWRPLDILFPFFVNISAFNTAGETSSSDLNNVQSLRERHSQLYTRCVAVQCLSKISLSDHRPDYLSLFDDSASSHASGLLTLAAGISTVSQVSTVSGDFRETFECTFALIYLKLILRGVPWPAFLSVGQWGRSARLCRYDGTSSTGNKNLKDPY